MQPPTSTISPQPSPTPLMTAAEFVLRHDGDRVELVKGLVRGLPMPSFKHGRICAEMVYLLCDHVKKHDLGHVMSNDSFVKQAASPTVSVAQMCVSVATSVCRRERCRKACACDTGSCRGVRSPSERWNEVFAKVVEYLDAGVRVVILLDEPSATASVYRFDELQQIFHNGDALVVPDVLPSFSVPVQRLFE